jgi:hypothetical protein
MFGRHGGGEMDVVVDFGDFREITRVQDARLQLERRGEIIF